MWVSGVNSTICTCNVNDDDNNLCRNLICVVFITFQNDVSHFNVLRQQ